MPVFEAKKRANRKWDKNHYDIVTLRIRKDKEPTKETIAKAAEKAG